MERYHLRRGDKALEDKDELVRILKEQKHVTLALCSDNQPYLVTMNHGFDEEAHCLYFHCAPVGKKIDLLRANPQVWGQALEDGGYLDGECDHAYRTVQFQGRAEFVTDVGEKRRALALMIEQLESSPEPVKARNLLPEKIAGVCIIRVRLSGMTGKSGPEPNS
jgi:nitroimidazol reductase NimA-like FMN-containing flavoprotein (pyridoxamine 5'-phosphate oxidase superfamily)